MRHTARTNSRVIALKKTMVLEKPYQLCLKGYYEMQEEHDAYLKAFDLLESLGSTNPDQVEKLEKTKSNIEERLSANYLKTRDLRKEICLCNVALELNKHIEEKIQALDEANKSDNQKRMVAKRTVRNLLER